MAKYAAENYDMPRVFASANSEGVPDKSPILNGIIASVLVGCGALLPNQDVFWSFFSVGVFTLMVSYVPMFPAFLKLRRIDPDRERPFQGGGKGLLLKLMAYVPMALIVVSLVFTVVPMNASPEGTLHQDPAVRGATVRSPMSCSRARRATPRLIIALSTAWRTPTLSWPRPKQARPGVL